MTERGTVLGGRYELDQVIGRGGMAEVWRARDRRLVRDVAIKRLRVDLASDPTFQARFRREAQSAAGLNHPNIVAVYDTGEELDTKSDVSVPYIVMELVEGVTLRDVLRDGRKILPERALEFTRGVLDALAYSHRAGIIHRDIKPANVMLTPDGSVKVMDFGIARAVADTSATMTQTAAVIGTAQYLSPEQARGEKVDNRSDIYSVGCLLYELLVSQPPFKGDSPVSVAYQHVREIPVAPSTLDPEINPDMDAVVLKALEKDPANRYQDAREFSDDVTRAMNGEPVHAIAPAAAVAATSVLTSQTQTHVAQRAAVPVTPQSPLEDELPEEEDEEKKSRTGVIVLSSLAAVLVIGMIVAIWMIMNPRTPELEMAAVPSVIGQREDAAIIAIENNNLEAVIEPVVSSENDLGFVTEQEPRDGELPVGSEVTIFVGQGPDTRTIPENLVGMTEAEARAALVAEGFADENISTQDADPADEPRDAIAGNVTASNPAEGAEAEPDREIILTIATGRSLVPDLSDMTEDEARDAAQRAGFTEPFEVTYEDSEEEPGTILDQDPAANRPLLRSEAIRISVAQAPEPVTSGPAPRLLGLTEGEARSVAEDAGFKIEIIEEITADQEADRIYAQNPTEGTDAPFSEPIEVTIAKAPPTTGSVPNLIGLTVEAAALAVEEAGFGAGVDVLEVETDEHPEGEIFEQFPLAGAPYGLDEAIRVSVAIPVS